MEFNEKLQELRKQKGLTQEELAQLLFVSRTAVSKWESGRGFPSIESLKAIAKLFSVSLDALLSGEEILAIAEKDNKEKENTIRDLVLGLLDCGMALLLFLLVLWAVHSCIFWCSSSHSFASASTIHSALTPKIPVSGNCSY